MDENESKQDESTRYAESASFNNIHDQHDKYTEQSKPTDSDPDEEFYKAVEQSWQSIKLEWSKMDFGKRLEIGIAAIGLGAIVVYTVFSILQWSQIRWTNRLTRESLNGNSSSIQQTLDKMTWQIKETHEIAKQTLAQAQHTERLANETHDLSSEAKVQSNNTTSIANSTQGELESMKTQFQLDQRAWVGVQDIVIDDSVEYPTEDPNIMRTAETAGVKIKINGVSFSIVNSGKTPATITRFSGIMEPGKMDYISRVFNPEGRIEMSTPVPVDVLIPNHTGKAEFTGVTMNGNLRQYPAIQVQAFILYKDFWGNPHTTKVCFYSFVPFDGPGKYIYRSEPNSNTED